MHGTHMKYMLVAAAALAIGLLASGTPVQSLLPFLLLLACPLMMVLMMLGMRGSGDQHDSGADPQRQEKQPLKR